MPILFSTNDVARLSGLTYRQIDYWTRIDVLWPTVEASGSGSVRRYDGREVRVAAVGGELARMGCPLRTIRRAAIRLRQLFLTEPSFDGLLHVDSNGEVSRLVARSGWLVDVRPVLERIAA